MVRIVVAFISGRSDVYEGDLHFYRNAQTGTFVIEQSGKVVMDVGLEIITDIIIRVSR